MEEEKNDSLKPFWRLLVGVLIAWFILWISVYSILINFEWSTRGQVGDMFGVVNSLFSGLALAGIIFAIILQKKELGYQRKELKATRKEFQQQNITLKKQRFENTFFQMLSLHNEIVNHLSYREGHNLFEKRQFFEGVYNHLKNTTIKNSIKLFKIPITDIKFENHKELITTTYKQFFTRFQSYLGHYFRNLYYIYKYIYMTDLIEDNEKQFYGAVARAQLSSFELLLIFYNSFLGLGFPKFRYLITEYDILANIDWKSIILDPDKVLFESEEVIDDPFEPLL